MKLSRFVDSFVAVRSEKVPKSLDQVCGKSFTPVPVEII